MDPHLFENTTGGCWADFGKYTSGKLRVRPRSQPCMGNKNLYT